MSGWGTLTEGGRRSDQLQTLAIPILSMANCYADMNNVNNETMFCAGYLEVGKGMALL